MLRTLVPIAAAAAAMHNELQRGLATLASGETVDGAARFAQGTGRHGRFGG